VIILTNVRKTFGSTVAVSDLTLSITGGEVVGLLGPNGAGKTTTLKLLVGLLRPDSGRITIADHDISEKPEEAKRHIGYVPDTPFIYDKLTGREFLQLVGGLYGMTTTQIETRTERLFSMFGIGDWRDERAEGYSHGMRQRVVICSAMLHRPDALVIDEPMVGLDPQSARLVRDLFRKSARAGTAVLLSTHSLHLAEEVCDRIAIIHEGRLAALGSKEELVRQAETEGATLEELFLDITGGVLTAEEP
jgi:ABC-2 type transport system ATP-binding protein